MSRSLSSSWECSIAKQHPTQTSKQPGTRAPGNAKFILNAKEEIALKWLFIVIQNEEFLGKFWSSSVGTSLWKAASKSSREQQQLHLPQNLAGERTRSLGCSGSNSLLYVSEENNQREVRMPQSRKQRTSDSCRLSVDVNRIRSRFKLHQ